MYSLFHCVEQSYLMILRHHGFIPYIFKIRRNFSGFIFSKLKFPAVETHDFSAGCTQLPATRLRRMNDTSIRCPCEAACIETAAFYAVAKIQYVLRSKDVAVSSGTQNSAS